MEGLSVTELSKIMTENNVSESAIQTLEGMKLCFVCDTIKYYAFIYFTYLISQFPNTWWRR